MATPLDASMPPGLDLGPGFTLRVTALSATDGSVVSAVNVSSLSILASTEGPAGAIDVGDLAYGPWGLVPGPGA